jgi:ABC-type uncharacterized transport system substrate-binding protein
MRYLILFLAGLCFSQESILVIRPSGKNYDLVLEGLKSNAPEKYTIIDLNISGLRIPALRNTLMRSDVRSVIVLDQKSLKAGEIVRVINPGMPVFFGAIPLEALHNSPIVKSIGGVTFEMSSVTAVNTLKGFFREKRFKDILVFYCQEYESSIKNTQEIFKSHNVELNAVLVKQCKPDFKKMNSYTNELLKNKKLDAIVALLDNRLLSKEAISSYWTKVKSIPIIVPSENLINSDIGIGVLSIEPDYYRMGGQLMGMVEDHLEEGLSPRIEMPISFIHKINKKKAFKLNLVFVPDSDFLVEVVY